MIKQKIINILLRNPKTNRKLFMYSQYKNYKVLVKNNKYKISKEEKKAIREYWKPYRKNVAVDSHNLYYNLSGIRDPKYIPDYLYYGYIDYYFNNFKLNVAYEDKNYYDIWFKEFNKPTTIVHNIAKVYYDKDYNMINEKTAFDLIEKAFKKNSELIIKPTVETQCGDNVTVVTKMDEIKKWISEFKKGNFIVQELVHQHKNLAVMHESSVNTIRIASLIWKDKIYILSAIVRIGVDGKRVDNSAKGGYCVGIDEKGHTKKYGYDKYANPATIHPQGFVFENGVIPNYEKLCETVKKAHEKLAHFKLIHWDFAVDEKGEPVLIECNIGRGGIYVFQYCNGPFFGDLTKEILDEVFSEDTELII